MSSNIPDIRSDFDQANYDPARIAPYTLEDPLTFLDGSKVKNASDWAERRKEILGIFAKEMYGEEPPVPEDLIFEKFEEKDGALAGFAVREQYRMWFKEDKSGPEIDWLLLRPRHVKKPVPVIIFLNYRGNHQLITDEEVMIPDMWAGLIEGHKVPAARGVMNNPNENTVVPVGMLIAAGYAVLTACYCQISPDPRSNEKEENFRQANFAYTGVFDLWGKRDESRSDNTTALGAWAWTISRAVDMVEKIPELDASKIVVTGCSRLGKSALLAAARDERIPVCVPVQCGGGGATLAKRDFGENIGTEMRMFSHWYCKAYGKYARNPAQLLTFDQHLLVAAVAPRKLLIAGYDSMWFDPEGEFISCRAASPAWEICGKSGMPEVSYPDDYDTCGIGEYLGFYHRTEEHGIAPFDWLQLLKFADF